VFLTEEFSLELKTGLEVKFNERYYLNEAKTWKSERNNELSNLVPRAHVTLDQNEIVNLGDVQKDWACAVV